MARRQREDAGERRTAFLGVQLTPSERAEIDARAEAVGRIVSDFARIVLLSDLKNPAPSARDPQAIRALTVELVRVGNNLNQLTAVANATRAVPHLGELKPVTDEIIKALNHVMAL